MSLVLPLLCLAAYLIGSVPFGYVLARARGVDLRRIGSGNVGATNTARALGLRFGLVAFGFDFLKGFAPASLFPGLVRDAPLGPRALAMVFGGLAVAGHVFPVFLRFRGGKGVATSAGFLAAVAPRALAVALLVWAVVLVATRIMSVASLAAAISFPATLSLLRENQEDRPLLVLAVVLAAGIVYLHRGNLARLLRGEEPRIGVRRRGEEP